MFDDVNAVDLARADDVRVRVPRSAQAKGFAVMPTSWVIGCAGDCDLIVERPTVSGHHCRLTREGDGYVVEDLGSTNGTFVNGTRLSGKMRVSESDTVTLGPNTPMPWPAGTGTQMFTRKTLTLGREADNDIVVNLPIVSGHHARLVWEGKPGELVVEDLGSSNGTAVGSPDRKVTRAVVTAADTVFFGTHSIPAAQLLARFEPALAPKLSLRGAQMVLGRNADCDRSIDHGSVSGRHARLFRAGGNIVIEDLGSTNGTFVNGQRISGPVTVSGGDQIMLGSQVFTLDDGGTVAITSPVRTVQEMAVPSSTTASAPAAGVGTPPAVASSGSGPKMAIYGLAAVAACLCVALGAWFFGTRAQTNREVVQAPEPAAVPEKKQSERVVATAAPAPAPEPASRPASEPTVAQATAAPITSKPGETPAPSAFTQPGAPAPVHPGQPPQRDPAFAWADSLDLGHLSVKDEIRLGRELNRLILTANRQYEKDNLEQRIDEVAQHLVDQRARKDIEYTFIVLDSDAVNAFSHPGGYIYVCRGLFDMFGEDEDYILEFVVGHEIAHVDLNHAVKFLEGGNVEEKKNGVSTLLQFYLVIACGLLPDKDEFAADAWVFERMKKEGRTRRECLAFLRKFKKYAESHEFAKGHMPPTLDKSDTSAVENHFRSLPAARKRLSNLETLAGPIVAPISSPPR
jgi:pSer/pThr/pTyr-binding forkhead associated (FHA) protein